MEGGWITGIKTEEINVPTTVRWLYLQQCLIYFMNKQKTRVQRLQIWGKEMWNINYLIYSACIYWSIILVNVYNSPVTPPKKQFNVEGKKV